MRERRTLGLVTVVLGASVLADAVGVIFQIEQLARLGLMIYLFLAPLCALWFGLDLLRRPVTVLAEPELGHAVVQQHRTAEVRGV